MRPRTTQPTALTIRPRLATLISALALFGMPKEGPVFEPLARPLWRGRTNVDALTIAALEYAESLRRTRGAEFYITQGSYQGGGGDINSAGTHDGGGVIDIRWTGDSHDIWCLRKAGFAAWHRTPQQGPWPDHIHAVLGGHPLLAGSAARQWQSYCDGRNGLASNGPDDGPRLNPIPVFTPTLFLEEDDVSAEDIWTYQVPVHGEDRKQPAQWALAQARSNAVAANKAVGELAQSVGDLAKIVTDTRLTAPQRKQLADDIVSRTAAAVERLDAAAVAEQLEITVKE